MYSLMSAISEFLTIAPSVSPIFAIIGGGGVVGIYKLIQQRSSSRSFGKPIDIFSGNNLIYNELTKLRGKAVQFDTVLDFSVWNEISMRIVLETEYKEITQKPASELNGKMLPLYTLREGARLDSFSTLIVTLKDCNRLKFSCGGTGVFQVLFKGKFEVEVRAYSGPSTELTLREVG